MSRAVSRVETAQPPGRSAPTHANRMVIAPDNFGAHSPFLMLAEDWFAPPAGFPTHPHRGMETVTLVLEGEMEHRDHTGAHGVIGQGDVQWMTAGKGVMHSEMPGPKGVHSLQLWLNLPKDRKMSKARYCDQPAAEVPILSGEGFEVRVYAGRQGETSQPHGSSYPMALATARLDQGAHCELAIEPEHRGFLYLVSGKLRIGERALSAGQTAWFDPGADAGIAIEALEPAFAALYAGQPIDEPVAAYGPFVMTNMDEIRQAFEDYRRGDFV